MDAIEPRAEPLERGTVNVGDREVRWTAWGDPDGPTVLDLPHIGESGIRLPRAFAQAIRDAGVRVVMVARAGLGGSTPNPERSIESNADDALRVADALGLERFVLIGRCMSTSAALTLAARHPERRERLVLVSAMAPFRADDAGSYLNSTMRGIRFIYGGWGPLARWSVRQVAKAFRKDPLGEIKRLLRVTPEVDLPIASNPEHMAIGAEEMADLFVDEAVALAEYQNLIARWPVDLATVRTPVTLWHGELDRTAPVAMARWLSRRLNGSRLELLESVGHMWAPEVERRVFEDVRAGIDAAGRALGSSRLLPGVDLDDGAALLDRMEGTETRWP